MVVGSRPCPCPLHHGWLQFFLTFPCGLGRPCLHACRLVQYHEHCSGFAVRQLKGGVFANLGQPLKRVLGDFGRAVQTDVNVEQCSWHQTRRYLSRCSHPLQSGWWQPFQTLLCGHCWQSLHARLIRQSRMCRSRARAAVLLQFAALLSSVFAALFKATRP